MGLVGEFGSVPLFVGSIVVLGPWEDWSSPPRTNARDDIGALIALVLVAAALVWRSALDWAFLSFAVALSAGARLCTQHWR